MHRFDGGIVKLWDFGIARQKEDPNDVSYAETRIGTAEAMAPEIYKGKVG